MPERRFSMAFGKLYVMVDGCSFYCCSLKENVCIPRGIGSYSSLPVFAKHFDSTVNFARRLVSVLGGFLFLDITPRVLRGQLNKSVRTGTAKPHACGYAWIEALSYI